MIDVSDGLAKDARALAPTGAEPALLAGRIPRRAGASLAEAVGDGEDYELLLAVSGREGGARLESAWRRAFPRLALTRIGRFVRAGRLPRGAVRLADFRGYEHLR